MNHLTLIFFIDLAVAIAFIPSEHQAAYSDDAGLLQQDKIDEIVSQATKAVVGIAFEDGFDSSGVIISKDGLVLSHCHHIASLSFSIGNAVLPRKIPVVLDDGTEVEAKLLLTHRDTHGLVEYSLLRLIGDREWPYLEISTEDIPAAGSWCLHFGHPFGWKKSRQSVPRLGLVALANRGGIASTCLIAPGDSGGPLVDMHGKIIGITTGGSGWKRTDATFHINATIVRSNPLALESESAALEKEVHTVRNPRILLTPPRLVLPNSSRITVQILSGEAVVALGTIVDRSGLVVTKLSEIEKDVKILLPDKRAVNCQLVAASPKHDLALLRVPESGLAETHFSAEKIKRGMVVVSCTISPDEFTMGIVGDDRLLEIRANDYQAWPDLKTGELSRRRSDFQSVFVHDCAIQPNACGGPVTDIDGRLQGVNIACAGRDATYAIPIAKVLEFVEKNKRASAIENKP
jgi:S1-C subfamily serine protease